MAADRNSWREDIPAEEDGQDIAGVDEDQLDHHHFLVLKTAPLVAVLDHPYHSQHHIATVVDDILSLPPFLVGPYLFLVVEQDYFVQMWESMKLRGVSHLVSDQR